MSIKQVIRHLVRRNNFVYKGYRFLAFIKCSLGRYLSDEAYLKLLYWESTGKKLDLQHPIGYNAKLQWLKLHDRKPEYTIMADKYEVRKYISRTIGEQYLVKLYGVYNKFNEIDFSCLPKKFVIKCTHDSGSVVVCTDDSSIDYKSVNKRLTRALKNNYYYNTREWPYKDIKPRIIIEEFLECQDGEEIKDYKMFCFNGRVEYTQVHYDRTIEHKANVYDRNWNYVNVRFSNYPSDAERVIEKPKKYDEMLKIAEILSKNIPHVRVDLYYVNNKIYFGELTFFHATGLAEFYPPEFDEKLGKLITII